MQERKLENLAMVVSLVGVLLILFVSEKMEAGSLSIIDVNESYLGNNVKITGEVVRLIETEGLLILDVKDDSGKIKVVAFSDEYVDVQENDKVEIEGEVVEYKNETELDAKVIKVL